MIAHLLGPHVDDQWSRKLAGLTDEVAPHEDLRRRGGEERGGRCLVDFFFRGIKIHLQYPVESDDDGVHLGMK